MVIGALCAECSVDELIVVGGREKRVAQVPTFKVIGECCCDGLSFDASLFFLGRAGWGDGQAEEQGGASRGGQHGPSVRSPRCLYKRERAPEWRLQGVKPPGSRRLGPLPSNVIPLRYPTRAMSEPNILIFDVETTGTDKQRDQVIELCAQFGLGDEAKSTT